MNYEELRRECLQFGDFSPDESGDLTAIVAAITMKGQPFPNRLAIMMAEYVEDERSSRLRVIPAPSGGELTVGDAQETPAERALRLLKEMPVPFEDDRFERPPWSVFWQQRREIMAADRAARQESDGQA